MPVDVTVTEDSVTLSGEECRRLRRSSRILSDTELRKKLRWLEYAKSGPTPPCIGISEGEEFVVVDLDPVHADRKTLEVPRTAEFGIDGKRHEGVLYRVWFRTRDPETVKKIYAVELPQQDPARTYVAETVNLESGTTNECVVRTSVESEPVPTTTADFQLYPRPEPGVFDE
jgi:hypothetical protein